MSNINQIAKQISSIPGIQDVNVWEKYGKSRVYIELPKLNGGKNWNGGRACQCWYDAETNKITARQFAGAATRKRAIEILNEITENLNIDFSIK